MARQTTDRTTVVLPPKLKQRATACARRKGVSFSEFVRQVLQEAVSRAPAKPAGGRDPFWTNVPVYDGPVPSDLSVNHDKYLYDEEP